MKPLEQYVIHYNQIMITLLRLGLSGYDKKTCFWAFYCEYLMQNSLFCGVHGKAWLLIAYII